MFRSSVRVPTVALCSGLCLSAWGLACASSEASGPPSATAVEAESSEAPEPAAEVAPSGASEAAPSGASEAAEPAAAESIHGLTMKMLDGTEAPLSAWEGKAVLVVNTASKCGHTPQYEGLQALHAEYESRGFAVLGFPSNDFGGQEPGSAEEIKTFCTSIYGVNFPMFDKVHTKGPEQAPLYAMLSKAYGEPQWNFHKYLIDKHGRPVRAWASAVKPRDPEIIEAIEQALAAE